jgi:arylsulfatase A-like enzyme
MRLLLLVLTIVFTCRNQVFAAESAAEPPTRPNLVVIFTDDQGCNDVGCYGSEIATPNIDAMAKRGLKFTQFYAASSICTPSRFGLFTGRYAHRSQDQLLGALMFLSDVDARRGIRPHETTYPARLSQVGYVSDLVGKWHLGHGDPQFSPLRHGFDSFFGHTGGCIDFFTLRYGNEPDWYRDQELVDTQGYATDVITDEAVRVIQRRAAEERPFHLFVSYNAPHYAKGWDEQEQKAINTMHPKPADLARVADITDPLRRQYAAKVVGVDDGVGAIFKALDGAGLSERTLVLFMTDHGGDPDYGGSNTPLRGSKATLYEGGVRVPCLAVWQGTIPAGTETDAPACAIDLAPTFCRLAGIDASFESKEGRRFDGHDLSDLLRSGGQRGADALTSRTLIWRTGGHAELSRRAWAAIRQGDWKLVLDPARQPQLFNIADDPLEQHDLAANDPERVAALQQLLQSDLQHRPE